MSLIEQQNFLAKLLVDNNLRESFWLEPENIGQENGLNKVEIEQISQIVEKDFNFFAESLYFKRLEEVEKLLPMTLATLGQPKFREYFRKFAQTFLPSSIKKHLEDAVNFAQFLKINEFEQSFQKEIVKFEEAKLLFYGYGRQFILRVLRLDLTNPKVCLAQKTAKRLRIFVWIRFGKTIKFYNF